MKKSYDELMKKLFQSLIGRLQTSVMGIDARCAAFLFQSLIGRLQTGLVSDCAFMFTPRFNPS